ncbi:Serine/threonine protein kinase [Taphrina deformans PYCC 5710]|uniref:Mechanosensitive ion channel protein n=1 Tax=Taphrina deformans (strain PYCC 5710 / ATCC 11124 / CBS 356.35 / IMI 108563 / JCM 9778 / NBRC 8474) TaxID=1097556 RepID=R4XB06_TAPDE|nr:Serine/threonine protein kinase [Taphrina deformans PYCC 5710]|eukprot:CCG83008.1 Serine/threonine protein kinase [Taphrina deformans PYCC 5710]
MAGTPQRQFVELRDLSPPLRGDHSYVRSTSFEENERRKEEYDNQYGNHDQLDSEQTYHENDTSSQSPIVENEKQPKIRRRKAWKEANQRTRVTKAGLFYRKVMDFSFITRWLLFILPLAILLAVPIVVGSFETHAQIGGVRIVWLFLWIEIVWVGLWGAKLVARLLPYVFRFVVSVVSISTTKYAGMLKALEVPISLFFWSLICLSTFSPIMTRNPTQRAENDTGLKSWESIMAKILTAAFFSSAFFLGEKILIQLIALNFHKVQYEMRITENKWAVQMLAKLLSHSRTMFPRFGGDFMEEDHLLEPAAFTGLHQRGRESRMGSTGAVTPMQFVNGARRVFQVGAGIVGAVGSEVSGKKLDINQSTYSIVVEALLNQTRTDALARRIWLSFVQEGNEALLPEDILEVFGQDEQENAEAAFTFFDEDLNGDVSLDEMLMKCTEVAKERRAISASLKDTDSAIGKLDAVLVVIVGIIAVFIFIALLDTSFKTLLATSATGLLSLSFVFATTCQEIMGSLIFLFVKHPFDVSDRIIIADKQYIVQEMSLMFTILKRTDGTQVQAPNSLLNTLFIDNVRRSAAMSETLNLDIDFDTTFEQIEALRTEMFDFIQRESRDFQQVFDITINDISSLSKMKISMSIKHKANWQNDALRAQRRNKWMCALTMAVRKLGIVASGPGSGDPKNPFIVSQVSFDSKKAGDPFSTPAGATSISSSGQRMDSHSQLPEFDTTLGTRDLNTRAFDVDLRREGESERIDARLPFTIAEENDFLIDDEDEKQGLIGNGKANQASRSDGLARQSTHASRLSESISRTMTGRRQSRRSSNRDDDRV